MEEQMFYVFYENISGIQKEIGMQWTIEGIRRLIKIFMEEHHYKAPYWRSWTGENGEIWFDVGSHSEFFVARPKR